MDFERMTCPDAVPAPLRLSPKHFRTPSTAAKPQPQATRCHALSRLPSQPVFDGTDGFDQESLHALKLCRCPMSPTSSPVSPISPRSSLSSGSTSTSGGFGSPSRDFSSLFMKSPALRHDLEQCACHRLESSPRESFGPVRGGSRSSVASVCSSTNSSET